MRYPSILLVSALTIGLLAASMVTTSSVRASSLTTCELHASIVKVLPGRQAKTEDWPAKRRVKIKVGKVTSGVERRHCDRLLVEDTVVEVWLETPDEKVAAKVLKDGAKVRLSYEYSYSYDHQKKRDHHLYIWGLLGAT